MADSDVSQEVEKTPLSQAQRKAAQRLRDKANGYVEITVKVPADRVDEARKWCAKLKPVKRKVDPAAKLPDLFEDAGS